MKHMAWHLIPVKERNKPQFAARLKERMEAEGVTKEELVKRVSQCGPITLPRWLNPEWLGSRAFPPMQSIKEMATMMNCAPEYLTGETDNPSPFPKPNFSPYDPPPTTEPPFSQAEILTRIRLLINAAEDGGMAAELVDTWRWVLKNRIAVNQVDKDRTANLWGDDPAMFFFMAAVQHFAAPLAAALENVDLGKYRLELVRD